MQRLLTRVREFFREESLGITVPVGVVLGLSLFYLLEQVGFTVILAIETRSGGQAAIIPTTFHRLRFNDR